MTTTTKTFADYGITIPAYAAPNDTGEVATLCPKCSHLRRPEHRQHRCLSVNVDKGLWHCQHPDCGWSGGLQYGEQGASRMRDLSPRRETHVWIKPTPPEHPTLGEKALDWFLARGITADTLGAFGVYATRHFFPEIKAEAPALCFPYLVDGDVVNVKYRCATEKTFAMVKGARKTFYNLDRCRDKEMVVIVEGEIDALSVYQAGIPAVLSVPNGANSLTPEVRESGERVIDAAKRVILAVDDDEAGRKLEAELSRSIGLVKCARAKWLTGCKDANEVLVRHGAAMLRRCIEEAVPYPLDGVIKVRDLVDALLDLYDNGLRGGVSTGWPTFDKYYRPAPGRVTVVTGDSGEGKALALDTPLPTPDGWTTMGAVRVGDHLIDERGVPCVVTAATPVMHGRPCYRLTFSDGATIIADAQHRWLTDTIASRLSARRARLNGRSTGRDCLPRGTDQREKRVLPEIVTTETIAATLTVAGKTNRSVDTCRPLDLPHRDLPIDPYVLGAWLGDGRTHGGAITAFDTEVLDGIRAAGYRITPHSGNGAYGIYGLQAQLRAAGVLGNKHIPPAYLRASRVQRLALLQGLMDTDGYVNERGGCEYTSTSSRLALDVCELVASFGWIMGLSEGIATLYGKDCGRKYRVRFTPDLPIFRIARKREYLAPATSQRTRRRYIVACEPVASVPVRCVAVDAPSHLYLAGNGFVPTHNSEVCDDLFINLVEKHEWRFALFSPENAPLQRHLAKLITKWRREPFGAGPWPRMTRESAATSAMLLDEYFTFINPETPTVKAVIERAEQLVYREGIRGVMLDPWNQFAHERPKHLMETEYISHALTGIQQFARRCDVHVWIVVHPTKRAAVIDPATGESKRPMATPFDLAGSMAWFTKADNIFAVKRDKLDWTKPVQVQVQKVRFREDGKEGVCFFTYDPVTTRFSEIPQID